MDGDDEAEDADEEGEEGETNRRTAHRKSLPDREDPDVLHPHVFLCILSL